MHSIDTAVFFNFTISQMLFWKRWRPFLICWCTDLWWYNFLKITLNLLFPDVGSFPPCLKYWKLQSNPFCVQALTCKTWHRPHALLQTSNHLPSYLKWLLHNVLIQPHFDYASSAWYPNLQKKLSDKLQICQNKCIRFCLSLGNRSHIGIK